MLDTVCKYAGKMIRVESKKAEEHAHLHFRLTSSNVA